MTTQDIVRAFGDWVSISEKRKLDYKNFATWIARDATDKQVNAVIRHGAIQFFNDFVVES